MITKIDREKLGSLVESFYNVTGIKVAVYDNKFCKAFSYPQSDSAFCTLISENKDLCDNCNQSTKKLCEKCAVEKSVIIEKCHAGLTEVAAPLTDGFSVIGYIMFGQVTNIKDKEAFVKNVLNRCDGFNLDENALTEALGNILYYSNKQLDDASKILNALAGYIVYEKIIYPAETSVAYKIVEYIRENLEKDLSVDALCKKFYMSRAAIYKITKIHMPCGIADFVRGERIAKAKELLRCTDKCVSEIAAETGFSDVDYFLRVFKRECKISAIKYRKE